LSAAGNKTAQLALNIATNFDITAGNFNSNATSVTHGIGGNFTMTGGTFDDSRISLRMDGNNGDQNIQTIAPVFNLVVNKFVGLVTSSSVITVKNALTLTNGKIRLSSYDLILPSTATAISGEGPTKYIIAQGSGRLTQMFPAGSTKTFPVGTLGAYMPVTVGLTGGSTADNLSVRLRDTLYTFGESGTPVTNSAVGGLWVVSEAVAGGSDATITLQWPQTLELPGFNRNFSRLGAYTSSWEYGPADIPASGTNPYTVSRGGFTSFAAFAVTQLATLPVTWFNVDGKHFEGNNRVEWTTVQEKDNAYFLIEASVNSQQFHTVGRTAAVTNYAAPNAYHFIHRNVSSPVTYYRIRQVDKNGSYSFSAVISIYAPGAGTGALSLSPNPVAAAATLTVGSRFQQPVQLRILNVLGKVERTITKTLQPGNNKLAIDFTHEASGIHYLEIRYTNGTKETLKFLKL
ncbi:MAG: T9SS type A sorting domain-containing protein, partial [Chitinophagaceae bacterium]